MYLVVLDYNHYCIASVYLINHLYGNEISSFNEYRRHRPITAKHCKPNDEILFVASTYLSYLESARKRKIIQSIYSKGERSVQQAANIVGLALPEIIDRPYSPIDQRSQQ
ncbi:unnamed protein product [Rotaria magnacalcarata]